jgi:hypothetical protein
VPVRRVVLMALFIALSAAGAGIHIPGVLGTPALDSMAGYLGAMAFGAAFGAPVAALGHLLTAALSGFPLTLPVHLAIAALMAVAAGTTGWLWRRLGPLAAIVWGILFNGVIEPALFIPIPGFGPAFFAASVGQLVIASALNVGLASALCYALQRRGVLAPWARWLRG